jgi:carboxyl-terminal processing protease
MPRTCGLAFLLLGAACNAQLNGDSARVAGLLSILSERHFAPRAVDDGFSSDVYTAYLRVLDPDSLYLSDRERSSLEVHRLLIDDQLKQGVLPFQLECDSLMDHGLLRALSIVEGMQFKAPLQAANADDAKLIRRSQARLAKQADELKSLMEATDASLQTGQLALNLTASRARSELLEQLESGAAERFNLFLSTLAGVFDAQSTYLSANARAAFDHAMTSEFVGVGIALVRDGARLRAAGIEPGSPAALSGTIERGDELVQVSGGDGTLVPVLGLAVEDVVKLLRGHNGSTVDLRLRKPHGSMIAVSLQRALVRPEAGRARAWLVPDSAGILGLIKLPRFYADLAGGDGPSCATDVAALLDELQQKDIVGLVIDLRENQGGSMSETIRMLSLFLDKGPVAQRLARDGNLRVLSTTAEKARYRGPMVVLVNEGSGSASEFFAAALQDHRRAVIMGAPRTYGKGTIQSIVDLPPVLGPDGTASAAGAVKLTVGLFFRPSGISVQLNGVVPDVVLPSTHEDEPIGERALPFALDHPGIAPVDFTPWAVDAAASEASLTRARARTSGSVDHVAFRPTQVKAPWNANASKVEGESRVLDSATKQALLLLSDMSAARETE